MKEHARLIMKSFSNEVEWLYEIFCIAARFSRIERKYNTKSSYDWMRLSFHIQFMKLIYLAN